MREGGRGRSGGSAGLAGDRSRSPRRPPFHILRRRRGRPPRRRFTRTRFRLRGTRVAQNKTRRFLPNKKIDAVGGVNRGFQFEVRHRMETLDIFSLIRDRSRSRRIQEMTSFLMAAANLWRNARSLANTTWTSNQFTQGQVHSRASFRREKHWGYLSLEFMFKKISCVPMNTVLRMTRSPRVRFGKPGEVEASLLPPPGLLLVSAAVRC
ncbi:uncharacterized protein [Canis lupus baileyi]